MNKEKKKYDLSHLLKDQNSVYLSMTWFVVFWSEIFIGRPAIRREWA
jgi:hypothetical protein